MAPNMHHWPVFDLCTVKILSKRETRCVIIKSEVKKRYIRYSDGQESTV
jgi:hypothetical protein